MRECETLLSRSDTEIVLVNNGSEDNTMDLMIHYEKMYSNLVVVNLDNNMGYGGGIIHGLKNSSGEIIGWTHADNQTNPKDFIKTFHFFDGDEDIFVKGYRYGRSLADYFFSYSMGLFESILLKKWLIEINAQPTVFKRTFFEEWKNPPYDFSLDLYAYYMAVINRLEVKRIRVKFGPRLYGESKWNLGFRSRMKFIKRTIKFSFNLKKR